MATPEGMAALSPMYPEDEGECEFSPTSTAVDMKSIERKSSSIKIKQPPRSYNKHNEEDQIHSTNEESEQRMYDLATWQMYQRITSFRESRAGTSMPPRLPGEPPLPPASSSRAPRRLFSTWPKMAELETSSAQDLSKTLPTSMDHEEVFTLDL